MLNFCEIVTACMPVQAVVKANGQE